MSPSQPPPGPPSRAPISQSPQPDRWPGTRWTHPRVPDHQSSRKDWTLWRGARIMAETMAVQRHAPLQTTQLHTAINAYFLNNSHISVEQSYFRRHSYFLLLNTTHVYHNVRLNRWIFFKSNKGGSLLLICYLLHDLHFSLFCFKMYLWLRCDLTMAAGVPERMWHILCDVSSHF